MSNVGRSKYQVRWRLLPRGKWTDWQYCDKDTYKIGSDEGLETRLAPPGEPRVLKPKLLKENS